MERPKTPEGHMLAVDEIGNFLGRSERTILQLELTFKSGNNYYTLWKKVTGKERKVVRTEKATNLSARKVEKTAKKKAA